MVQPLQNEYFKKEVSRMSVGKMGLTIKEAAETTGIGRNTMRKLVEWGKLPVRKLILSMMTPENTMVIILIT